MSALPIFCDAVKLEAIEPTKLNGSPPRRRCRTVVVPDARRVLCNELDDPAEFNRLWRPPTNPRRSISDTELRAAFNVQRLHVADDEPSGPALEVKKPASPPFLATLWPQPPPKLPPGLPPPKSQDFRIA